MSQAKIILAALLALQFQHAAFGASRFPAHASFQPPARQKASDLTGTAVNRVRLLVDEVLAASYPELKQADIQIKPFRSQSDFFKARFGIPQYLLARMRYLVFVNPRVFELEAPEPGIRAIIAHELGHLTYYNGRNRVRLLGLVRLTSKSFSAEFERWADLKAISRGYGEGLKEYRSWLYANVPASRLAEKQRNYFSPEEIDAILSASRKRPELLEYWFSRVPLSLDQILAATK